MAEKNEYLRLDGHQTDAVGDTTNQINAYISSGTITSTPVFLAKRGAPWRTASITLLCPSTGSPDGTFKLQGCNDQETVSHGVGDINLVSWFDISGGSQAITGASLGSIDYVDPATRWIRAVYTPNSGSITLTLVIQLKD